MRRAAVTLALLLAATPARATVLRRLSPDDLAAGADLVVEGRVRSVGASLDHAGRGVVTTVTVDVERTLAGATRPTVRVLVPGGAVASGRQVVIGMPTFTAGEEVRVYLKRSPLDPSAFRVYGGWQGKWILGATLEMVPPPNGMVWPPYKIPVPYLINSAGSDDLALADVEVAIHAAFATWQAVPCSMLTYSYAGETTLGPAIDGQNVVLFTEADWIYGEEAAAATSLWIPVEAERTADIAMNGVNYHWAIGPSGALVPGTLDLQGVLTHEIGHFSGLGHSQSAHDTMYYSWTPWQSQRTLSADDERGLCAIYPGDVDECAGATDCDPGETCETYDHGTLCTAPAAPVGTFCNYDVVECESFCLFTALDLSTGYCSQMCASDLDCPEGYRCETASAGGTPVQVCFEGARPPDAGPPDAAPPPDAPALSCAAGCPVGEYCGPAGLCTFECRTAADCEQGASCTADGRCALAPSSGGCGCRALPGPGDTPAGGLLLLAAALLLSWPRSRTSPCARGCRAARTGDRRGSSSRRTGGAP